MTGPAEQPPHGYVTGGPIEPGAVMPDLDYPCRWMVGPEMQALMGDFLAGRTLPAPAGASVIETSGPIADSFIRELVESSRAEPAPAPSWADTPVTWDDLVDLYGQVDPPPLPRAIVADERTWDALRRVAPVVPRQHVTSLGAPFAGSLGNLLSIPVVVRREPRRARPVRRTGPLDGRPRARHAGALRVARLQRRVDRRAARRAPRPTPAVYGVFR